MPLFICHVQFPLVAQPAACAVPTRPHLDAFLHSQHTCAVATTQGTSLDNETAPVRLLASGVFVHLWRRFGQRRYTFLQRFFHSLYELADR